MLERKQTIEAHSIIKPLKTILKGLHLPEISGYELAGAEDKETTTTTRGPHRPTSYTSARSSTRGTLTKHLPVKGQTWHSPAKQLQPLTPLLKAFANLFDPTTYILCQFCKEECSNQATRCPRLGSTKQNIFRCHYTPLKVLSKFLGAHQGHNVVALDTKNQ